MIWGEPGYAINTGVYTLDDYPEYTKWVETSIKCEASNWMI